MARAEPSLGLSKRGLRATNPQDLRSWRPVPTTLLARVILSPHFYAKCRRPVPAIPMRRTNGLAAPFRRKWTYTQRAAGCLMNSYLA